MVNKEIPVRTVKRRAKKADSSLSSVKMHLAVLAGGITLSMSSGTFASLNIMTDPADQLAVLRKAARGGELLPVTAPDGGKSLRSAQWNNANWKNWRNTGPPS